MRCLIRRGTGTPCLYLVRKQTWQACALIASAVFVSTSRADCPPPNPAPPMVMLADLQAGQYNVGLDGVLAFAMTQPRNAWNNAGGGTAGAAAVDAYLKARPVPVVIGPQGRLHLVDNHHRASGIHYLNLEFGAPFPNYVYYSPIADFSQLSLPDFWTRMSQGGQVYGNDCTPVGTLQQKYLWPFDRGVLQDPNINPPPMIPGLRDDVLRSISANARSANGYADLEDNDTPDPPYVFYYQEFYWANFLRNQIFLQGADWELHGGNPQALHVFVALAGETPAQTLKRVVAAAALLCRSSEAGSLPGWSCPADVYADSLIDGKDISAVLWGWGSSVSERYGLPTADVNQDGEVNGLDLGEVVTKWGTCGL